MASKMTQDEFSQSLKGRGDYTTEQGYNMTQNRLQATKSAIDKQALADLKAYNEELNKAKKTEAEIAELLARKKKELDAQAKAQKEQAEANIHAYQLTHSTLEELIQISEARAAELAAQQQALQLELQMADTTERKNKAIEEAAENAERLADEQERLARFHRAVAEADEDGATYAQKKAAAAERIAKAEAQVKNAKKNRDQRLKAADSDEEKKQINEQFDIDLANIADGLDLGSVASKIVTGLAGPLGAAVQIFSGVSDVVNKIHDKLDGSVDEAMGIISKYMGPMDARLQSLDTNAINFSNIQDDINHKIGISPYVSQKSLFETVNELVSQGIAYNVEQRAFIEELSDRMVTTFDVLDASLTRLIRLQQADMTMSQMGSEAQLTKFLNYMFEDTSYLNSLYDTINSAIIDASSQLDVDQATQYGYAVQKWLSSLYSVGMSDSTVQAVAKGITALSTGDVNTLNGNEALRILLGQSAAYGGMSLDTLLTNGMTATEVNNLMKSMVEYLQDIANNTSNNVTKAAYANMLNVTLSDLVAAGNLTTNDINSIYNSNISYQSAMNETANQLSLVSDRTTLAQKIDTVIDNLLIDFGMQVAENDWMYGTWKANGVIRDITSGFSGDSGNSNGIIGTITKVLGTISTVATMAVEIGAFVQTLSDAFTSIGNEWGLGGFEWSAYTSRGEGLAAALQEASAAGTLAATGVVRTGTSYSGVATSNASAADAAMVTLAENAEKTSYAASTVTDVTSTMIRDVSDMYAELFEQQTTPIRVRLASLEGTALEQLLIEDSNKKLSSVERTVTNKVNVDIVNDDINTITRNIYTVRGSLI